MKYIIIMIVGVICLVLFSGYVGYGLYEDINPRNYEERSFLYSKSNWSNTTRPNGVYYTDYDMRIWVKDRELAEISRTVMHEMCHHFVYGDPAHFCKRCLNNSIID